MTFGGPMEAVLARPLRPSSAGNSDWDRALRQRDDIRAILERQLSDESIEAAVIVSENGNYPPWVRLEAWLPDAAAGPSAPLAPESRRRVLIEFIVSVAPYHRFPIGVTARLIKGAKRLELASRPDVGDREIRSWVSFALDRGPSPSNYHPVRDAFTAFLLGLVPFYESPHANRLEEAYRPSRFSPEGLLWGAAVLLLWLGLGSLAENPVGVVPILLGVLAGVGAFALGRQPQVIVTSTEPRVARPRRLGIVDSWHAVATDCGGIAGDFETRVAKALAAAAEGKDLGVSIRPERVAYRTQNGYEERQRYVISRNQATVLMDIHAAGDDLYVGWHGYLNWAQWVETAPVSTRKEGGVSRLFRALTPGLYRPGELDLFDLDCVADLVHRALRDELERLAKKREIDAAIDFEIVRGDRRRAFDAKRHAGETDGREKTWTSLMSGLASWQSAGSSGPVAAAIAAEDPTPARAAVAGSALGLAAIAGVADYIITASGLANAAQYDLGGYTLRLSWVATSSLTLALGALIFGRVSVVAAIRISVIYAILGPVLNAALYFVIQEMFAFDFTAELFGDLLSSRGFAAIRAGIELFLSLVAMMLALRSVLPKIVFSRMRLIAALVVSAIDAAFWGFMIANPDIYSEIALSYRGLLDAAALIAYALVGAWIGLARLPRNS